MRNPLDLSTLARFGKAGMAATLPLPDAASLAHKTNLEELAQELRNRLEWTLREVVGQGLGFEVACDPARQEHVIAWPRPGAGDQPGFLGYLRLLVQARMVESVHVLFAGPQYATASDPALCKEAAPAMAAAVDWFVDYDLYTLCPDRMGVELAAHYRAALRRLDTPGGLDASAAVAMALTLAKGRYFLRRNLRISGPLEPLVEAFGRTPANKPSLFTLRALVTRLMALRHEAVAEVVASPFGASWLLRRVGS